MTRRLWILAALPVLIAALPSALHASGTGHVEAQSTVLYVVFIPGLCGPIPDPNCHTPVNAATRGRSTFKVLQAAMRGAHVRYAAPYYSYDPRNPVSYSARTTQQSVARDITALERLLRSIRKR